MRKSYKQFMLVIDWLHPLPEGHDHGFNYEFFDTLDELKARAFELMDFRNKTNYPEGWRLPGRPHHVNAMKLVGSAVEKDKYGTAVAYECIAVLWGIGVRDCWCVKEWSYEEEWKSKGSAIDKVEAYFRNRDDKLMSVSFGWDNYEAIKESKKRKVC